MDQKKKKLRSLTRIFLLWGILFLLLPGCRTNIAARSDTQEKTLRNREILVGNSLLEAFRKNDFTALTGILAAYGGPIPARKDFLHSQKEFSKQFGEMISYCYLTDLETPLFRNCAARLQEKKAAAAVMHFLQPAVLVALLILCTAYLVDGSFNPFLYFRF